MQKRPKKRLTIAFRDGDKWVLSKISKDYEPRLRGILTYIYGVEKPDVNVTLEAVFRNVRNQLLKDLELVNSDIPLLTLLIRGCHKLGMRYAWDTYFPDFIIKVKSVSKEILGSSFKIKDDDILSFFEYRLKIWRPKIQREINKLLASNGLKSKREKNASPILKHFYHQFEGNISWLIDHPEKEILKKLKDPIHPVWEEVRVNFSNKYKNKFEDIYRDLAIDALRVKFKNSNFRLYCLINTWLFVVAKNLRPKIEPSMPWPEEISPSSASESFETGLFIIEESNIRIDHLFTLLIFFNLMIRVFKRGLREQRKIKILIERTYLKKSWEEIIVKCKLTNARAAAVANSEYKKKLNSEFQQILKPLAKNLFGDIAFRFTRNEDSKCLGIVVFDYSTIELEAFLDTIHKFVHGQIITIGRTKDNQISSMSQEYIKYFQKYFIAENGIKGLEGAIRLAMNHAQSNPYSIILLDSTIHGRSGATNLEQAEIEFNLFNQILLAYTPINDSDPYEIT